MPGLNVRLQLSGIDFRIGIVFQHNFAVVHQVLTRRDKLLYRARIGGNKKKAKKQNYAKPQAFQFL